MFLKLQLLSIYFCKILAFFNCSFMPLGYYDLLYTYRKRILQNGLHIVRSSIKCILFVEIASLIGWYVVIEYFNVVVSIWSLLFVHLANRVHQLVNDDFSLKIYSRFTILHLLNVFCMLFIWTYYSMVIHKLNRYNYFSYEK